MADTTHAQSEEAAHRRAEHELRRESDQVLRLRAEVKDMQVKKMNLRNFIKNIARL